MRAPEVFAWVFGVVAGLVVANAFAPQLGFSMSVPSMEQFRPPKEVFSSDQSFLTNVVGDFLWALNMLKMWLGGLDDMVATVAGVLGVPEPLNGILVLATLVVLAGFIIYLVSGRQVFA